MHLVAATEMRTVHEQRRRTLILAQYARQQSEADVSADAFHLAYITRRLATGRSSFMSLRRRALASTRSAPAAAKLCPAIVSAVPKACPNEVARPVFRWLVAARTGSSDGIPIVSPALCPALIMLRPMVRFHLAPQKT